MIDVKHLSKSFGDHLVLDDISEHIHPGEKVVVIGPSGSGKSTFLRCLNLLEIPTKGSITFDGTEITDPKVDIDRIRRQMGMVFQHFNLFPNMTIRKNITLAPVQTGLMKQAQADQQAMELLRRVGLEDKADSYPNQLSGHDHGGGHPRDGLCPGGGGPGPLYGRWENRGAEYPCGDFQPSPGGADQGVPLQSALRKRETALPCAAAERLFFAWGACQGGGCCGFLPTPLERQGTEPSRAGPYFFPRNGAPAGQAIVPCRSNGVRKDPQWPPPGRAPFPPVPTAQKSPQETGSRREIPPRRLLPFLSLC